MPACKVPPNITDMNLVMREPWPVERFLFWEDAQEGKHEFDGTRIIEMTGGSRRHQRIVFNLMRLLAERLTPDLFDARDAGRSGRQGLVPGRVGLCR